jgi:hypothetical protein
MILQFIVSNILYILSYSVNIEYWEDIMKILKLTYVMASLVGMSVLSTGAFADVAQLRQMTPEALNKKVINDLALASGNMMGKKTMARKNLADAREGISVLKEKGHDAKDIMDHEETVSDFESILGPSRGG